MSMSQTANEMIRLKDENKRLSTLLREEMVKIEVCDSHMADGTNLQFPQQVSQESEGEANKDTTDDDAAEDRATRKVVGESEAENARLAEEKARLQSSLQAAIGKVTVDVAV